MRGWYLDLFYLQWSAAVTDTDPTGEEPGGSGGSLARDVAGTLGTRIITMAVTARMLGPESRGIFTLIALFPASVITLAKFGQAQATVYFIRREKEDVGQVVANVLYLALACSLLLVLAIVLFREQLLGTVLKGASSWSLAVVLPLVPLLLMESYLYAALQATDRFKVYNTRLLAESVITLAAMTVVLVGFEAGLPGALAVVITVRAMMGAWVLWSVNRQTPISRGFDLALFRRMFRYGIKSHVQIIASHFHFKADIYMVAYFLNPAQVAFYSIAARLAEHLMYIPQSLGMAMFPRLAGSSEREVHLMTARACRQVLVISGLAAAVLAVTGRWFITLWYGRDFAPAAAPLPWVCGGIVMMSLYVLLSRNFTSRNKQQVNIIAAYIALAGNLGLNFLLIPSQGIVGAAMATTVSYSVAAMLLLVFFLRESGLGLSEVLIIRRSDIDSWRRAVAELLRKSGG